MQISTYTDVCVKITQTYAYVYTSTYLRICTFLGLIGIRQGASCACSRELARQRRVRKPLARFASRHADARPLGPSKDEALPEQGHLRVRSNRLIRYDDM